MKQGELPELCWRRPEHLSVVEDESQAPHVLGSVVVGAEHGKKGGGTFTKRLGGIGMRIVDIEKQLSAIARNVKVFE